MGTWSGTRVVLAVLLVAAHAEVAAGQRACVAAVRDVATMTPRVRLRASQDDAMHPVARDAARCVPSDDRPPPVRFIVPSVQVGYMGGVPDQDPGSVAWGGRGLSVIGSGGVAADFGNLHAVLSPSVSWRANAPFFVFPSVDGGRSVFASPWYAGSFSADLPLRFGADPSTLLEPGETAGWISGYGLEAGVSSSTQQWGPGARGALMIGGSAPGIPRVFVRSGDFLSSPVGAWSGVAFRGVLTESRFFDRSSDNDRRGLDAGMLAWKPSASSGLTLGAGVAVMSLRATDSAAVPVRERTRRETMVNAFASIRDSARTMHVWVELARRGDDLRLRDFARVPQAGVVYLVGVERRIPRDGHSWLLSAEAANLEQRAEFQERTPRDFYTSIEIPHGWTQRGRPLGHWAGPGGQAQWAELARIDPAWTFGLYAERVRRNQDAFFRQYLPYPQRHDVTLRGGAIVSRVLRVGELSLDASWGRRLNYLFQNTRHIRGYRTVDVGVPRLSVRFTPAR